MLLRASPGMAKARDVMAQVRGTGASRAGPAARRARSPRTCRPGRLHHQPARLVATASAAAAIATIGTSRAKRVATIGANRSSRVAEPRWSSRAFNWLLKH